MKKLLILLPLLLVAVLVVPKSTKAVYQNFGQTEPITAPGQNGNCVLTPDPNEKSDTVTYTLNVEKTVRISRLYKEIWDRYANCNELTWHAEHNTPIDRLTNWLFTVEKNRYLNHEYIGTVRTEGGKIWRLINGKRQRVYDWLTMVSWGYLSQDTHSIHKNLTNVFFAAYPEIEPLNYSDGPYHSQVQEMWLEGNREANVPQKLLQELLFKGFSMEYFILRNPFSKHSESDYDSKVFDFGWLGLNRCEYKSINYQGVMDNVCDE